MKVEVYTIISEKDRMTDVHPGVLPLFLEHYSKNFPGCIINVYVHYAKKESLELLKKFNCNIFPFPNFKKYDIEDSAQELKSNVWKSSKADWVIVCDLDELVQIDSKELDKLKDIDLIQFKGYHMVNKDSVKELKDINYGFPDWYYNKACVFRPTIEKVDFDKGAHTCVISKSLKLSKLEYKLFHYCADVFTEERFINRFFKVVLENELVKKIITEHNSSDANNLKLAEESWRINYNTIEKLK